MIAHAEAEPDDHMGVGGIRSLLHRLRRRGPTADERIAALIDAHRRDLESHRARFAETVDDLVRREGLLSDAKASLERLLRLSTRDLDARETDVARLVAELTDRGQRLHEQEVELARRRSEIGAVELRRERVQQREKVLAEREAAIEARAGALPGLAVEGPRLAFVPGPGYRLVELDEGAASGEHLVLEGERFEIARVGPSPLPQDRRRCAYLVLGRREDPPGGSR